MCAGALHSIVLVLVLVCVHACVHVSAVICVCPYMRGMLVHILLYCCCLVVFLLVVACATTMLTACGRLPLRSIDTSQCRHMQLQANALAHMAAVLDVDSPPAILASHPYDLVIGIMSARHHVAQRQAQRKTWVGHAARTLNKRWVRSLLDTSRGSLNLGGRLLAYMYTTRSQSIAHAWWPLDWSAGCSCGL